MKKLVLLFFSLPILVFAQYTGPEYKWIETTDGCSLYSHTNKYVLWIGECKDGKIHGTGVLNSFDEKDSPYIMQHMQVFAENGFVLKGKVFSGLRQYNLPSSTTEYESETGYLDIEYVYSRSQEKDQQTPTLLIVEEQTSGFKQVGELHSPNKGVVKAMIYPDEEYVIGSYVNNQLVRSYTIEEFNTYMHRYDDAAFYHKIIPIEQYLPIKNLSITYFDNADNNLELNPLIKGLPDMLVTQLSSMESVKLLEREKLDLLLEEIELGKSGYINTATAQQIGQGIGSEYILTGGFFLLDDILRIDAKLIDVESGEIIFSESIDGTKETFFDMSKKLADQLYELLEKSLSKKEIFNLHQSIKPYRESYVTQKSNNYLYLAHCFYDSIRHDKGDIINHEKHQMKVDSALFYVSKSIEESQMNLEAQEYKRLMLKQLVEKYGLFYKPDLTQWEYSLLEKTYFNWVTNENGFFQHPNQYIAENGDWIAAQSAFTLFAYEKSKDSNSQICLNWKDKYFECLDKMINPKIDFSDIIKQELKENALLLFTATFSYHYDYEKMIDYGPQYNKIHTSGELTWNIGYSYYILAVWSDDYQLSVEEKRNSCANAIKYFKEANNLDYVHQNDNFIMGMVYKTWAYTYPIGQSSESFAVIDKPNKEGKQHFESSIYYFEKVSKDDYGYLNALENLGMTYMLLDKRQESLNAYKKSILELNSGDYQQINDAVVERSYGNAAEAAKKLKDYKSMYELLSEGVDRYPNSGFLLNNLCEYYIEVKEYDKGIETIEKATRLDESDYIFDTAGDVYRASGNLEQALKNYFKATILNPSYSPGYLHIAQIYEEQKNDEHVNFYIQAAELNNEDAKLWVAMNKNKIENNSKSKENDSNDYIEKLKQLSELKDLGIITEEEFQKKKQEILNNF